MKRVLGMALGLGLAGNVEASSLRQDLRYLANFAKENGAVEDNVFEAEYKGAFVSYTDVDRDGEISSPDVLWISSDRFTLRDVGLDGMLTGLVTQEREFFQKGQIWYRVITPAHQNFEGYMIDMNGRHYRACFLERPSPSSDFGLKVQEVDKKIDREIKRLLR